MRYVGSMATFVRSWQVGVDLNFVPIKSSVKMLAIVLIFPGLPLMYLESPPLLSLPQVTMDPSVFKAVKALSVVKSLATPD